MLCETKDSNGDSNNWPRDQLLQLSPEKEQFEHSLLDSNLGVLIDSSSYESNIVSLAMSKIIILVWEAE